MRFNHKSIAPLSLALILTSTGCGMMGNKTPPQAAQKDVGSGCLNNAQSLFQKYSKGQITDSEWKGAFDCVNESLNMFTQFVHGTSEDAYTQSDMYNFVSRFLITNKNVKRDLLRGAFQLKASLLGGNSVEFRKDEIEVFKSVLPRIRDITTDLIPYLAIQNKNSDYASYLEMAEAFKRAGEQLSDLVNSLPVGVLSEKSVNLLVEQLAASLNIPMIDGLSEKVFIGKWFLFNSRPDAVEVQDWGQIVKSAMGLGGLAVAAMKAPQGDFANDYRYREFLWDIAQRARPYLNDAIARHGGVIPFPILDHLIDQIPEDSVPAPHQILKQSMRPLLRKILGSNSKIGIDTQVLDTVYTQGALWVKNVGLLDRLYEAEGLNPEETPKLILEARMNHFASTLTGPDQAQFLKIKTSLLSYIPQFYKNTNRIKFTAGLDYSKKQHFFVLSVQQLLEHAHKSYGSGDNYFVESDFQAIYKDFVDLLFALKAVDPTVSNFAGKRFQDLDLFTQASDGDGKASFQEIVYYAMLLVSASDMKMELKNEIVPRCDQNLGEDILGWKWIAASCFRNEFHNRLEFWLSYFPNLKSYWQGLTQAQHNQAMIWLEHGARRDGYSEQEFGSFDFQALPTIFHYTESMFSRFSENRGTDLTKQQIFNAFPIFRVLLAKKANTQASKTYLLQGIFTYIVRYREMPDTKTASGIARLVWWLTIYKMPTTKVSTDRVGLYNIVCLLGLPESVGQQELTPKICKP